MAKMSLRAKIKTILNLKLPKTDVWSSAEITAWKNFCLTTPGFLQLANKIPSDVTLDNNSIKVIDDLYEKLKESKKKPEKPKEQTQTKKKSSKKK